MQTVIIKRKEGMISDVETFTGLEANVEMLLCKFIHSGSDQSMCGELSTIHSFAIELIQNAFIFGVTPRPNFIKHASIKTCQAHKYIA